MPHDKRRDARTRPEDEPFTSIQTYDEPAVDKEGRALPEEEAPDETARDDVAIGFERPPVRPREAQ